MVLLIDNYDSFTYNLVQYLGGMGCSVNVVRNDQVTVDEIRALRPERIVISPGPCTPSDAGIIVEVVRELHKEYPILGVCLGHQAIAEAMGGRIIKAPEIVHGKTSQICHTSNTLFDGVPNPFTAARYHSLIVERASLPSFLKVNAWTSNDIVMGIEHETCPTFGVQFHPESIATEHGKRILSNFLNSEI
jgi:anthranilate synthase/aminodeoxychorismate synthase-like glutamine amidotransferase